MFEVLFFAGDILVKGLMLEFFHFVGVSDWIDCQDTSSDAANREMILFEKFSLFLSQKLEP